MSVPAVLARNLTFRYPAGDLALGPLDLAVAGGEVVVVLGPNGSGKSTLLRLLATDLWPSSGDLRLLGLPAAPPRPELRRRIGWAPDEAVHFAPLTGRENARFFLELASGGGTDSRASNPTGRGRPRHHPRESGLEALLEAFRLDEVADVPVERYSFGMRRKLLLVEALAGVPDLLLMDEPTVGLDPPAIESLGIRVRAAATRGAAILIATNEILSAPEWADRVVFLHRGRVVHDGDPVELRAGLRGRTRIRIQMEGEPNDGAAFALPALDGVEVVASDPSRIEAETRDGGRCLPRLLDALMKDGARIREIRVREPDLGDLFREITGEALGSAEPEGHASAEPGGHGA